MQSLPSFVATGNSGFNEKLPHQGISKIQLHIQLKNLPNLDTFSKTDPFVVVSLYNSKTRNYIEIGRTEVIFDNLNPRFVTSPKIDYHFESIQNLRFDVYDCDNIKKMSNLKSQEYVGSFEKQLADIVCNGSTTGVLKKKGRNTSASITILGTEVAECNLVINAQFAAVGLPRMDFLGKSDPFFVIERLEESRGYLPVYKSPIIRRNLNPTWKPCQIPMNTLSNGDWDSPLKITVYDWNRNGAHDFIGSCMCSVRDLVDMGSNKMKSTVALINPVKQKKKRKYQNSGYFKVVSCKAIKRHSFLDYLRGGVDLNLVIAVDFTASNGAVTNPLSLHYQSTSSYNQYQRALATVVDVMQHYDTDKLFPCFGFGAKMPNGQVSHCFPLNGNFENPNVAGLEGVMGAYTAALSNIQLYGPTIFSKIVSVASDAARETQKNNDGYIVLLILTDGVLNDAQKTIDRIVEASNLPLSIIIVGVGDANFSAMDVLDADEEPLKHSINGKLGRDIVQFIPFKEYSNLPAASLASALLEEIPVQLVDYFKSRNIKPRPPRTMEYAQSFYNSVQKGDAKTATSTSSS